MARFLKRRWFWSILLLIIAVVVFFYWNSFPRFLLSDGSVLVLRDVKFGTEGSLIYGNVLQRALVDRIPPDGLKMGGLTLSRPFTTDGTGVHVLFDLKGKDEQAEQELRSSLEDISKYRLLLWGDDGFIYDGWISFWPQNSDGLLIFSTDQCYPRTSTNLHFRILKMDQDFDSSQTIAEFSVKNPAPLVPAAWLPVDFPVKVTNGVYTGVLSDVQVKNAKLDPTGDFYKICSQISLQLLVDGKPTPAAITRRVSILDATTNSFDGGFEGGWEKGWRHTKEYLRSPDPTLPWRIHWWLTLPPDLNETNQISIHLPHDQNGPTETENNGLIMFCNQMSKGRLFVRPGDYSTSSDLVFLHAKNHLGEVIPQEVLKTEDEIPGFFTILWEPGKLQFPINLTFAWAERAEFEFIVKPRLVKEFTEFDSTAE